MSNKPYCSISLKPKLVDSFLQRLPEICLNSQFNSVILLKIKDELFCVISCLWCGFNVAETTKPNKNV